MVSLLLLLVSINAFQNRSWNTPASLTNLSFVINNRKKSIDQKSRTLLWNNDEKPILQTITDEDEGASKEELLKVVEANEPEQWMVMKEVLGLNIFTLILAILIAFFMGTNAILGPGWLGSRIGIEATGSFNEISGSMPDIIDLGQPDYLL